MLVISHRRYGSSLYRHLQVNSRKSFLRIAVSLKNAPGNPWVPGIVGRDFTA